MANIFYVRAWRRKCKRACYPSQRIIREDAQRHKWCRQIRKGLLRVPGMEIGYVVRDAKKWEVDTERDASQFDAWYYGKLLRKAWDEVAFVLQCDLHN